jgi:hypothetical protein
MGLILTSKADHLFDAFGIKYSQLMIHIEMAVLPSKLLPSW